MNETIMKTLGVTLGVCLLCSLFVSFTAVSLRDQQNTNKLNDKRVKILEERFTSVESNHGSECSYVYD